MTVQAARAQSSPGARRRPRRLHRPTAPVLAALAAASLLLAGCAAGQRAQTAIALPVLDGVGASVGQIDLRAVTITAPVSGSYAKGGTAGLQLYIVNTGPADKLVSVSSSAAASVTIAPNASAAFAASPAAATSSGAAGSPIGLASGETTPIGVTSAQPQVILTGLTEQLYPAMSVPITFTFANAGPVSFWVSVHLSNGAFTAPTAPTTHPITGD